MFGNTIQDKYEYKQNICTPCPNEKIANYKKLNV